MCHDMAIYRYIVPSLLSTICGNTFVFKVENGYSSVNCSGGILVDFTLLIDKATVHGKD